MEDNLLIHAGVFLLFFIFPGSCLLLSLSGCTRNIILLLIFAFGVSLNYCILLGLALLSLSVFSFETILLGCMAPAVIALWRRRTVFANLCMARFDRETVVSVAIVWCLLGVMLFATPRWTFLISPNMDAGNYETYSNHFWTHGTLYCDATSDVSRGVPLEWIHSRNTWMPSRASDTLLRPAYTYGFPIYLGVIKCIFKRPDVSWLGMAILSFASAGLLSILLTGLTTRWWLGTPLAMGVISTPLFFYYSKQIMAEQGALLGLLLVVSALASSDEDESVSPGVLFMSFCGFFLVLIVKLDTFVVAAFGILAFFLAALERTKEARRQVEVGITLGLATLFAGVIHALFISPKYLKHFSVPSLTLPPGVPFIVLYALVILCAGLAGRQLLKASVKGKGLRPRRRTQHLATVGCSVAWLAYMGWNLVLRPHGAPPQQAHDLINLQRLFVVSSPILLGLTLAAFPLALSGVALRLRYVLLMLAGVFCYTIFRSHHSAYDIWWMRRYLLSWTPLVCLSLGQVAWMVEQRSRRFAKIVAVALAGVCVFQLVQMRPFFPHEVNTHNPTMLAALLQVIPDDALLIAMGKESPIRGTTNTLRSLRHGPTLLNVEEKSLPMAMELYPERKTAVILAVQPLADKTLEKSKLQYVGRYPYAHQWKSKLVEIYANPTAGHNFSIYVYQR